MLPRLAGGVFSKLHWRPVAPGFRQLSATVYRPDSRFRGNECEAERAKFEDLGYRVIVIRYGQGLDGQINAHVDVFGPGL